MLETLQKKSRKSNITRIIVSILVVVGMLAVTKLAILDVITGPTKMDITLDPETYAGKYVTTDTEFLLYDYVEHTTTTTRKYGGKTTSTNGYSYLALQSIPDYEKETVAFYFYSVYLNKDKQSEMASIIEASNDYLFDESGNAAPPDPVTFTGTWTKMDAEMERYFRSSLAEFNVLEDDYKNFYFYELDTKRIGGMNIPLFWCLMAIAAFFVLYGFLSVLGLFSNAYMKSIHQYLQKDSSVSLAAIEEDFSQAHPIGKSVWVGKKWTVYMVGNRAMILANKDLVWGYYYSRTGRYSVSEMRLYSKDKKMSGISLTEKQTQEALKFYAAEQPQMVIGYTSELEKMFNKNFNGFMDLKYNPAMRGENLDEDFFRQ